MAFSGGAAVADQFDFELTGHASSLYFVLSQVASLALVYTFARIDWRRSSIERRLADAATASVVRRTPPDRRL